MTRTQSILIALLTAAVTLGAFEMWRTEPASRTFALAAGLFSAAVCLASSIQLLRARAPAVDLDGSISIPSSPIRAFVYSMGMGASAGAAYLLAFDNSARGYIAITVLLCGVAMVCAAIALYYLFRAVNGDPVYRLDCEGISSPSMRDWSLRWRDIRRIESFEIQYFARLYLQPTPEARRGLNWLERAYGMGVMGVVIGPGATGLPLSELERLVRDYWARYRA